MISFGYTVFQSERPLAHAEQRVADAQLGRYCAALARWSQSLARPPRARRREPATYLPGPRGCGPVDRDLTIRATH